MPSIVLYELYWFLRGVLSQRHQRDSSSDSLKPTTKVVGDNRGYTGEPPELTENPKRFNDMVILTTARDFEKLATYDKKFEERGKATRDKSGTLNPLINLLRDPQDRFVELLAYYSVLVVFP